MDSHVSSSAQSVTSQYYQPHTHHHQYQQHLHHQPQQHYEQHYEQPEWNPSLERELEELKNKFGRQRDSKWQVDEMSMPHCMQCNAVASSFPSHALACGPRLHARST